MRFLPALLLLLAAGSSQAVQYSAQPDSTLAFTSTFQGEAFSGSFETFTARVEFDPEALAATRFEVRVRLDSADTRNQERDEMLVGSEFFNALAVPEARFVATGARALGNGRFVTDGTLSLRGISRPVKLVFNWTPGARPVLEGTTELNRLAFDVGTGDWSDTGLLPDEVEVRTRLVLVAGE